MVISVCFRFVLKLWFSPLVILLVNIRCLQCWQYKIKSSQLIFDVCLLARYVNFTHFKWLHCKKIFSRFVITKYFLLSN